MIIALASKRDCVTWSLLSATMGYIEMWFENGSEPIVVSLVWDGSAASLVCCSPFHSCCQQASPCMFLWHSLWFEFQFPHSNISTTLATGQRIVFISFTQIMEGVIKNSGFSSFLCQISAKIFLLFFFIEVRKTRTFTIIFKPCY